MWKAAEMTAESFFAAIGVSVAITLYYVMTSLHRIADSLQGIRNALDLRNQRDADRRES